MPFLKVIQSRSFRKWDLLSVEEVSMTNLKRSGTTDITDLLSADQFKSLPQNSQPFSNLRGLIQRLNLPTLNKNYSKAVSKFEKLSDT